MTAILKDVNIPEFIPQKKPAIIQRKKRKTKVKKYTFADYFEVIAGFVFFAGLIFALCFLASLHYVQ